MKALRNAAVLGFLTLATASTSLATTNYTVTTPNGASLPYFFAVSGPGVGSGQNPTINLQAGNTYTLTINTTPAFHPVDVTTATTFPYINNAYGGASPQDISTGTITLTIPATNYPTTLYYICDIHGFFGQINVTAPATPTPPPSNTIISIVLSATNIVVKSTGTNTTYNLVPEFNSNLVSGAWLSVTNFTNTFSNGTNTTSFGRLDAVCGSNVFLRISQRPPQ